MSTEEPEIIRSETHAYRVVESLGGGGQGTTLLVERVSEPGSRYVLKQLRLEHVEDWKQVELFEREVSTLADLRHPGIPRLVDRIVEDGRTAGIVQTRIPGQTVAERIAEGGPLSPARFEQILRQTLEILAYLQKQVPPVLHRDINPRNVMLDDERAYLIDFGAVRVGGTTDMTSVGTFGYMAPEQIIGRAGPASDLYGLGMTLVSLAERCDVGDLPIDPKTGQVDPSRLLSSVDPRIRDVLLGMIEPGLEGRIGRAHEALRRMDAPPPAPVEAPPVVVSRPGGPPWPAIASTITVLAILGGAAVMLLSRSTKSSAPKPAVPAFTTPERVDPDSLDGVLADEQVLAKIEREAIRRCTPTRVHGLSLVVGPEGTVVRLPPVERDEEDDCIFEVIEELGKFRPRDRESVELLVITPPSVLELPPELRGVTPSETADDSAALTISTTPQGAKAYVDGEPACDTPCTAHVSFGRHQIVVEHEGRRVDRAVNVLEDTTLEISLSK